MIYVLRHTTVHMLTFKIIIMLNKTLLKEKCRIMVKVEFDAGYKWFEIFDFGL